MQTNRPVEQSDKPDLDLEVQRIQLELEIQQKVIKNKLKASFYANQTKKMVDDLRLFIPSGYFADNWEIFDLFLEEPDLTPLVRMMRYRVFFEALKMVASIASRIISGYDTTSEQNINLVLMNIMVDVQIFPTYFKVLSVNHPSSELQVSHFEFFVDKSYLTAIISDTKRFNTLSSVLKSVTKFIEEIDSKITSTVCFMNNIRNETIDEAAYLDTFGDAADGLGMDMNRVEEKMTEIKSHKHPTTRKELAIIYLRNIASIASCHIATLQMINDASTQNLRELSVKAHTEWGYAKFKTAVLNMINFINFETGWLDLDTLCGIFAIYFKDADDSQYIAERVADLQETYEDALKFIERFDDSQMLVLEFYNQQQKFSGHITLLRDNQSVKMRMSRNQVYQASLEMKTGNSLANVPVAELIPRPLLVDVAAPSGPVNSMSPMQVAALNDELERTNQGLIDQNDFITRVDKYVVDLQKTQKLLLGVASLNTKLKQNLEQVKEYGIPPRKKFQKVIASIHEVFSQTDKLSVEDSPYTIENAGKLQLTWNVAYALFDKISVNIEKISEELKYLAQEAIIRQKAEVNKVKKDQRALAAKLKEEEEAERLRLKEEEDEKREAEEARLEAEEAARQEELEQKRQADLEQARLEKLEKQRLDKLEQQRLQELRLKELEKQRLAEIEKARLAKIEQVRLAKNLRREEGARRFLEIKAKRKAERLADKARKAEQRHQEEEEKARKIAEINERAQAERESNAKLAEAENLRKAAEEEEASKRNLAVLAEIQLQAEQSRQATEAIRLAEERVSLQLQHQQLMDDVERGRLLLESMSVALEQRPIIDLSTITFAPVPPDHTELTRAQSAPQSLTLKNLPIGVFTPGHSHTPSHSLSNSPFSFFAWGDSISPLARLLGDDASRNPSPTNSDQAQEDVIIQPGYRSPAPGMRHQYE